MEVKIRSRAPMDERYTYAGGISVHQTGQAPRKLRSVSQAIGRALAADRFESIRSEYNQTNK